MKKRKKTDRLLKLGIQGAPSRAGASRRRLARDPRKGMEGKGRARKSGEALTPVLSRSRASLQGVRPCAPRLSRGAVLDHRP